MNEPFTVKPLQLIDNQARIVRQAANESENSMVVLCLIMAAIIKYRPRNQLEYTAISEYDKRYYTSKLKPILEFILFIKQYFPSSVPPAHVLQLWQNRDASNRNENIEVDGKVGINSKKHVKLDSCRSCVSKIIPAYELHIDRFLEDLMRAKLILTGTAYTVYMTL